MKALWFRRRLACGALSVAVAASLGVGVLPARAATVSPFWGASNIETQTNAQLQSFVNSYLTTYGVRAGSAGGDYLGISNTNFDFTPGGATIDEQFNYLVDDVRNGKTYGKAISFTSAAAAGLALWGSSVNSAPNPFYQNLLANLYNGNTNLTAATTWMSNPTDSSWGDTNDIVSSKLLTTGACVAGQEFGNPDIVFGANKFGGWNNYALPTYGYDTTNWYNYITTASTYAMNDATNIWTQMYTLKELANKADATSQSMRYGTATAQAMAYEKAIKGNMLYIASQIDAHTQNPQNGVAKKTVAYLYAITDDGAYFFTPQASGLTTGDDTGDAANSSSTYTSTPTANGNYAANNATIDFGYMATLPFVTNTFTGGGYGTANNITMCVEDIYKSNPAVYVANSDIASALANVNVIIYNTNTDLATTGTNGGKNLSGITTSTVLDEDSDVSTWLSARGLTTAQISAINLIAGDDWGTSSKQPVPGETDTATAGGRAPLLYCQRNYTMDKNARAAWAFSQVYPELYNNNPNASYVYWVDNVYHAVGSTKAKEIAVYMENNSSQVTYDESRMEGWIQTGYNWWVDDEVYDASWYNYDYYTGSSRASYYDGLTDSETSSGTVGIFEPNMIWTFS